jgi:hypothetical protein
MRDVSSAGAVHVGMCQTVGPGGPLDQLDARTIWIREPGSPRVFRAIGRGRCFGLGAAGGEVSNGFPHRLHLDDEMIEATRIDSGTGWIVNELEADELVARKLEHRQTAELCSGTSATTS